MVFEIKIFNKEDGDKKFVIGRPIFLCNHTKILKDLKLAKNFQKGVDYWPLVM